MSKKQKKISIIIYVSLIVILTVLAFVVPAPENKETIQDTMADGVLHNINKVSLFGLLDVNPGLISAFMVTGIILLFALIVRIFVIPRFKMVPFKFQI